MANASCPLWSLMLCFVLVVFWPSGSDQAVAQPYARSAANFRHAEFRVDENAAHGTVVGALTDRYPHLTNFRLAPNSESQPFAVDSMSGQIVVSDGTALDFESRTLHSFSVHADRNVASEDPFLQQFAGSLLEEGISKDHLNELLIPTETIQVRIRLRNIPENPPVSELEVEIADHVSTDSDPATPAVVHSVDGHSILPSAVTNDAAPLVNQETLITSTMDASDIASPEIASSDIASSEIASSEIASSEIASSEIASSEIASSEIASSEIASSEIASSEIVPIATAEISSPSPVLDDLSESEHNAVAQPTIDPSLVEFSKNEFVVETIQSETTESALPASGEQPIASPYARDLGALILVIFITGFLLCGMYLNVLKSRRETRQPKESDSEDEESHAPEPVMIQEQSEEIPEEPRQRQDSDPDDEDLTIHREYQMAKSQLDESRDVIKQLRQEIEERDARIDDLKEKLEAVILRLEQRDSHSRAESDFRNGDNHGAFRSADVSSGDLWYDTSGNDLTCDEPRFDSDPRGSLARACGDLEKTLNRLANDPSAGQTGFPIRESFRDADTADTKGQNFPGNSGGSVSASFNDKESSVAIAEPETTLDERTEQYHSADETKSSEESHLDSVAQYLSNLLNRSNKGAAEEKNQADRRGSAGRTTGIEESRTVKRNQPVKSYIETYLDEHGGQLHQDLVELQQRQTASVSDVPSPIPVVRAPVDVRTIREHMNSFREVASQSVENALASYSWRQARGKLAWRTILLVALVIVTIVVVVTNTARTIRFASLNWLMEAIVLLTVAELFLRVQSIRRQQKLRQKGAPESKRYPHSRDAETADADATVAIR